MRGSVRFIAVIMFLMFVAGQFPTAQSAIEPHVIARYDDRTYEIGETINVSIETYIDGFLTWDGNLDVLLGDHKTRNGDEVDGKEGHYNYSFTLEREMINSWGRMYVTLRLQVGGSFAYEQYQIRTIYTDEFQTRVFIPDATDETPLPGQTIEFQVRTTFGGVPVDADAGSIEVYTGPRDYYGDPDPRMELEVTRISTGVYSGKFVIPPDLGIATEFPIHAEASHSVDQMTFKSRDDKRLFIHNLNVWVKVVEVIDSNATIDVHLTDLDGNAINNTPVNLSIIRYSFHGMGEPHSVWHQINSTNANGRAGFVLDLTKLENQYSSMDVQITVEHEGMEKTVTGYIHLDGREKTGYWRPHHELVRLLTPLPLPPGEGVSLEYQVPTGSNVTVITNVSVFIIEGATVYFSDRVPVDGDGLFHVDITIPEIPKGFFTSLDVLIEVNYERIGSESNSWSDFRSFLVVSDGRPLSHWERMVDEGLLVTMNPADEAGLYDVTVGGEDLDTDSAKVSILWGIHHPYTSDDHRWATGYYPQWDYYPGLWMGTNTNEYADQYFYSTTIEPCEWKEGEYRTQVRLPWFLPDDAQLYFLAIVENRTTLEASAAITMASMDEMWTWQEREPPIDIDEDPGPGDTEPEEPSPSDVIMELPTRSLLILIVVVVAIVSVAIYYRGRYLR